MTRQTLHPFNPNDEFYRDLDEKRSHASCCTCYTFSILFTILLLMAIGGVFYLYKLATTIQIFPKNEPLIAAIQSFHQKIGDINTKKDSNFELILTDEEMTGILSEGIKSGRFVIKEIQTVTDNDEMVIYGVLTEPLKSQIVIKAVPEARNGEFYLRIKEMKAGNFAFPSWLSKNFESTLSKMISSKLEILHQNLYLEEVKIENRQIRIIGKER